MSGLTGALGGAASGTSGTSGTTSASTSTSASSSGSASSGLTGMLPAVGDAAAGLDALQSENVQLKVQVAELTDQVRAQQEAMGRAKAAFDEQHAALEAAMVREEEANARAAKLAVAVDAGVAAERDPDEFYDGDMVEYRFRDVVTCQELSGPGVVVKAAEGALRVAPLSPAWLQLPTGAVQHTSVRAVTGEDEPTTSEEDA